MVRTTRSAQSTTLEDSPQQAQLQNRKALNKKRKRNSTGNATSDDQNDLDNIGGEPDSPTDKKSGKQDSINHKGLKRQKVKLEDHANGMDLDDELDSTRFKDAGRIFLSDQQASDLLLVLEALDGHDFLSQPIPVPPTRDPSSSQPAQTTMSIRTILQHPTSYSLRQLNPILRSSLPKKETRRSAFSPYETVQTELIKTALRLLDQVASSQLDVSRTDIEGDGSHNQLKKQDPAAKNSFALIQHIGTAELFTSAAELDADEAANLTRGQASLIRLSTTHPIDPSLLPNLGSYSRSFNRVPPTIRQPKGLVPGHFLDYGPFTSFAPTYESDGSSLSKEEFATLLWRKKQTLLKRMELRQKLDVNVAAPFLDQTTSPSVPETSNSKGDNETLDADLQHLLDQLRTECGVDELLGLNANAMQRLVQLQNERFSVGKKALTVVEGSEEWELAHSIEKALVTLVSLKPRIAGESEPPLLPPPSVVRALHRTLPLDPGVGWRGTLMRREDFAIVDNCTVKPGNTPYVPTPSATPAAQTASKSQAAAQAAAIPNQYHTRPSMATAASSYYQSYYQSYGQSSPAPNSSKLPGQQQQGYYYGYQYPVSQPGAYTQVAPGTQSRAIPNMGRPNAAISGGWGTPVAGGQSLPPHLRKTTTGGVSTPGTPTAGASPVQSYGGASPAYPSMNAQGTPGGYNAYSYGWQPSPQPAQNKV